MSIQAGFSLRVISIRNLHDLSTRAPACGPTTATTRARTGSR
jgi:hypothetical protein